MYSTLYILKIEEIVLPKRANHITDPVHEMLIAARAIMQSTELEMDSRLVSLDLFPDNPMKAPLCRVGDALTHNRYLVTANTYEFAIWKIGRV